MKGVGRPSIEKKRAPEGEAEKKGRAKPSPPLKQSLVRGAGDVLTEAEKLATSFPLKKLD
jgi:hypothetical protein